MTLLLIPYAWGHRFGLPGHRGEAMIAVYILPPYPKNQVSHIVCGDGMVLII